MFFLKKNFGLIMVLLLSFWAIKPLFIPGFFPMHDDTQVARVFEMGKMLQSGVFPVRWVADLGYGYGYPLFNFYAPLAYYVGGVFMLLGFDALLATKIMMAMGIILAGVFMYFLAREFFGKVGGVISGLFYTYAPYHAVDIYVRGDVAEFWAYSFIPLVALSFYKIYQISIEKSDPKSEILNIKYKIANIHIKFQKKVFRWIVVGALGYSAIILSHNLTALMVTPFLIIVTLLYCYIGYRRKKLFTIYYLLFTILLGLTISAFYWIPALLEIKSTNVLSQIGGDADFRDHFVCLQQLWSSPWGFGGSAKSCIDGMSFMIGKLHIFSVLSSALILIYLRLKRKHLNNIYHLGILSIVGFFVSIFLMLDLSRFVWQTIWPMAFFQYPWRFLILTSFFSSFLSGFAIWFLKKTAADSHFNTLMYCSTVILVFFILFFNLKFFIPQTIFPATSKDFTNEIALKWTASKTSDEFLPPNFKKPKSEKEIAKNPILFKETALGKASNAVSFIGALALIIGIIVRYGKNKR